MKCVWLNNYRTQSTLGIGLCSGLGGGGSWILDMDCASEDEFAQINFDLISFSEHNYYAGLC